MSTLDNIQTIDQDVMGGATEEDVDITSIDQAETFLMLTYRLDGTRIHETPKHAYCRAFFFDDDTVRFTRNLNDTDGVQVMLYIVRMSAGVTVEAHDLTIADIDFEADLTDQTGDLTNRYIFWSQKDSGNVVGADDGAQVWLENDGGTLKIKVTSAVENRQNQVTVYVVKDTGASVQRGTIDIGTGETSDTAAINEVVLAKSWISLSASWGSNMNPDDWMFNGKFNSTTQIQVEHVTAAIACTVRFEVVERTDDITVQEIDDSFGAGENDEDDTITAISAAANGSILFPHKGCWCKSDHSSSDNIAEGNLWAKIDTPTNVSVKRSPDQDASTCTRHYFVIDWGAVAVGALPKRRVVEASFPEELAVDF